MTLTSRLATALILICLCAGLSACGKRGDLEPPGGEPEEYPRQYPDPESL